MNSPNSFNAVLGRLYYLRRPIEVHDTRYRVSPSPRALREDDVVSPPLGQAIKQQGANERKQIGQQQPGHHQIAAGQRSDPTHQVRPQRIKRAGTIPRPIAQLGQVQVMRPVPSGKITGQIRLPLQRPFLEDPLKLALVKPALIRRSKQQTDTQQSKANFVTSQQQQRLGFFSGFKHEIVYTFRCGLLFQLLAVFRIKVTTVRPSSVAYRHGEGHAPHNGSICHC